MREKDVHSNTFLYAALGILAGWTILVMSGFYQEHQLGIARLYRLLTEFQPPPLPTSFFKILTAFRYLAMVCLLAGVGMLAGRRLLRMADIIDSEASPQNKWSTGQNLMLALGLGWGLLMYIVFLLGILGGLYPAMIWGLLTLLFLICYRDLPAFLRDVRSLFGTTDPQSLSPAVHAGMVWVKVILAFILVMAVAPSITHDAMVYHLGVPRVYADHHGFVAVPYDLFSNTFLNLEMLYTAALLVDDFILANLIHYTLGVAAVFFFYCFIRETFDSITAALASLIFFFNPSFLNEMPLAYGDLAMTFYFLLTTACFFKWQAENDRRWFVLLCVFSGIFAGMKYTSIHGLVALGCLIAVVRLASGGARIRNAVKSLAMFGGIVTVFVAPYLIKNYLITGNPVYPVMYGIFDGRWLVPRQAERMMAYVNSHGMGHDWRHLLALPWNITIFGKTGFENFDTTITPIWLIFLPAFVFIRPKPAMLKWVALLCAVFFVSWAASTHITRYMMPMFPFLSLLCAYTIITLKEKTEKSSQRLSAIFTTCAVLLCGVVWFSFSYFYLPLVPKKFGPVVWGKQTRDEFLSETIRNYSVFKYINEKLPSNARLIFFWDNRGFFCERPKIGDSVLEAPRMIELVDEAGSPSAFYEMLKEMGITHVYFNHLFYTWFPPHTTSEKDAARFQEDFKIFQAFLKDHCEPLFTSDWATVYAIRK